MAFRAICVALLLSSLPTAGCGTVANLVKPGLEGGKDPFGGVRHDVWYIKQAANGEWDPRAQPKSEWEQHRQAALMLCCAADLPFSLIGDVVTWPYTAAYTFINQPIPIPPVTPATAEAPPQIYLGPENKEPGKKTPEKAASSNNLNAYVTILLQKQPLAAAACSSYFLTPPKDAYQGK